MAMAGSAIGLGNIWRFPYIVGEYGGAAFVMVYIVMTLLVSLPVFIAEVTLGRRSRTSAYGAMSRLRPNRRRWKFTGALAIFIPLLIASYYSVIGGWSLEFLFKSSGAEFVRKSPEEVSSLFGGFITLSSKPVVMHLLFLGACASIVALGVRAGIERFNKLSIPVLFVLIVGMIIYSLTLPGSGEGVRYLLKPDFSQINAKTMTYALGQSFYSLSLGMGTIVTYGSYVDKKEDMVLSCAGTAVSDLFFAVLAGLAIMPAVFAAGIEPGAGPGLIFQSIPYIFSTLGATSPVASTVISALFFLAVLVAAITSCISLLEVGVSFFNEKYGIKRWVSSLMLFVLCGGVGVVCSLSFGPLSSWTIGGKCIFDFIDWLCSNIMLLILAFLVVIFVGFVMKRDEIRDEVSNGGDKKLNIKIFPLVYFLIKWVSPIAIAVIFISNFVL